MTPSPQPPKRHTKLIVGLVAAILLALTGTLVMAAYLTQRTEVPSAGGVPIPVISGIPRPPTGN